FLGCSAYKFYGPHVGALYGKRDLLESIDFPRLAPAPNTAPEIAETGTQNHEGIMGAAAAVDFLASLAGGDTRRARLQSAFDALHARGSALARQLWEGLASIKGVKLYGPPPDVRRTPTVAFTLDGYSSIDVTRALVERGIFASHGDFYAATVVARLGLAEDGLMRAGCACYTTAEECDRLIEGVRAIAKGQVL
ncbi:MAG TPA: aminotransferase class V-fold PLP-dependent enzyme, partial [Blastocatellia bacterium]